MRYFQIKTEKRMQRKFIAAKFPPLIRFESSLKRMQWNIIAAKFSPLVSDISMKVIAAFVYWTVSISYVCCIYLWGELLEKLSPLIFYNAVFVNFEGMYYTGKHCFCCISFKSRFRLFMDHLFQISSLFFSIGSSFSAMIFLYLKYMNLCFWQHIRF